LVDGKAFRNAVGECFIGKVPPRRQLCQLDGVGAVAVHFVRRHVYEGHTGAKLTQPFQQIEGANRVDVEVLEHNACCFVVTGLCRRVHNRIGTDGFYLVPNARSVADINLMMREVGEGLLQVVLHPSGIARRAEKGSPHVIVKPMYLPAMLAEEGANF